jgi:hypothetical protein
MRFKLVVIVAIAALTATAQAAPAPDEKGQIIFDPGNAREIANRYATKFPAKGRDVLAALRKLEIMVDDGISFDVYKKTLGDLVPEVVVFCESPEAKAFPEFVFFIGNATYCFRKVRDLWHDKLFADTPSERLDAATHMIFAPSYLWETASLNISAAKVLIEAKEGNVRKVLEDAAKDHDLFTGKKAIETINREVQKLKIEERKRMEAIERELEANRHAEDINQGKANQPEAAQNKEKDTSKSPLMRDWKRNDGRAVGKAIFISMANEYVRLRKTNGATIMVPFDKLSPEDQAWIRQRQKQRLSDSPPPPHRR